jgi:hypothetical protein
MARHHRPIRPGTAVAWLLLVAIAGSAADDPPLAGPDREWGVPDQGVQARLRPTKAAWGLDEVPTFALDLRNRGDKAVSQAAAVPYCEIEFDGVWYVYGEPVVIRMPVRVLPPGGQIDGWMTVSLDRPWVRKDCCPRPVRIDNPVKLDKVRLHTPPGKHVVRVSFLLEGGARPVSAGSEITVLLTDAVKAAK